jgi:outer membrane protein TolC
MARSEAEVAAERLKTALGLEADVGRRLKVGEIARSDLLLARQETASARAAAADAQLGVVRSLQRYRVLTGSDRLPDDPQEPVAVADNRAGRSPRRRRPGRYRARPRCPQTGSGVTPRGAECRCALSPRS